MPLIPVTLQTNLSQVMDPNDPLFTGFPENATLAIQNFADAINGYAQLVVPFTTPVSQQLGVQAFVNVMTPVTVPPTEQSPTFMDLFPPALMAYATQLALGMAPAFAGVPPLFTIELEPAWQIGLNGGTTQQVISSLVSIIDPWFRSGTAVQRWSLPAPHHRTSPRSQPHPDYRQRLRSARCPATSLSSAATYRARLKGPAGY